MKDGSFLAFRQLKQLVPEFNNFLAANPVNGSSELTGARMVGRWKSGAPVDLSPLQDDPALGIDPTRNNNFNFSHPEIAGFALASDESRCPFSAHIRKTHPRADLGMC
jgi:deferrochelatase/peroxidase EfeB